jgi:hypothetical protein
LFYISNFKEMFILIKNLFKKKDPVIAFWEWFESHEDELYIFREQDVEKLFGELNRMIMKVNPQLVFSCTVELIDSKRVFTIGGSGIGKNFPDVIRLVDAAPRLDRFSIVAFNQRQEFNNGVKINGIELTRDDVFFTYNQDQKQEDFYLTLYIKGYKGDYDSYFESVFELLEIVIGEYVLGTEIAEIKMKMYDTIEGLLPISDLPNVLDDVKKVI